MATRQTRARKPATKTASALLEALKFVSVAQHSEGTVMQTHCRLTNGQLIAFDGGITCGHKIEETLNVCPHTATLILALSKCQESISITELDSGKLSIKSGKFRATVPCVGLDDIPGVEPDPPIAALTDAVKNALAACIPLAQDGLPEAFLCGVLLQAGSAVATNRVTIIEAWHGVDLPPDLLLPKSSVAAIVKCSKPLKAFGFSKSSATFYFEDDSFIKTLLFENNFPNTQKVLNIESVPYPLPVGFYEALDNVAPFSEDGIVHFINGRMCSQNNSVEGAVYDVEGLTDGLAFKADQLKIIRPHALSVQFNANDRGMALFFGDNVRGAIMKVGNVKA